MQHSAARIIMVLSFIAGDSFEGEFSYLSPHAPASPNMPTMRLVVVPDQLLHLLCLVAHLRAR